MRQRSLISLWIKLFASYVKSLDEGSAERRHFNLTCSEMRGEGGAWRKKDKLTGFKHPFELRTSKRIHEGSRYGYSALVYGIVAY